MDANTWATSSEPYSMLDALQDAPAWNDDKVHLFACWCARHVSDLLRDERSRKGCPECKGTLDLLAEKERE